MKTLTLKAVLFALVIIGIASCEDLATVDVDTSFSKNMNIDVEKTVDQGMNLKNTNSGSYEFAKTDTLNLMDNNDLEDYLDRIKEINIETATCTLTGIPDGATVNELTIMVENTGMSVTLTDLSANEALSLTVESSILQAVGNYLLDQEMVVIKISGNASYAPFRLGVKLTFGSTVKAGVL